MRASSLRLEDELLPGLGREQIAGVGLPGAERLAVDDVRVVRLGVDVLRLVPLARASTTLETPTSPRSSRRISPWVTIASAPSFANAAVLRASALYWSTSIWRLWMAPLMSRACSWL